MESTTRLIQINFQPVTDVDVVGYFVHLVSGAPPYKTKTFVAYIPGITSSSYVFTGQAGKQYEFEITATDDPDPTIGVQSPPLNIFYPNGTAIATPITGPLTPDGNPMLVVRDTQYITSDEFLNYATGLKFTTSSPIYTSGQLDLYLKTASGMVNRFCRRHFNVQTVDEIYPAVRIGQDYPKLMTVFLNEKPVQNIISINLQILKYYIGVALDYLQLDPNAGFYSVVPMLMGGYSGYPVPNVIEGMNARVWTRYTFGYDVLPEEIKTATALIASKLISLGSQNPLSAQSVKFGRNFSLSWDSKSSPIDDQVKQMLSPYRKYSFGRASTPL